TLTLNPNGSFTYVPNTGYSGSDSFTYRAYDGATPSGNAPVTLTVTAVTTPPPTTNGNSYSVAHDRTLTVAVGSGVLVNDVPGVPGHTLTTNLVAGPAHGALTLN